MKNINEIKRKNINYLIYGSFFTSLAWIIISYFLPFFLKEKGLSIIEIGFLLTLGLAVGTLVFGRIYGIIIKKIKLKTGLFLTSILSFIYAIIMFIFPNKTGAFFTEIFGKFESGFANVSINSTFQHNNIKAESRKHSSKSLIYDSGAHVVGIILSIIFVGLFGFRWSFLIFSLFVIPSFFFFNKIKENTRFVLKKNKNRSWKFPKNLKLLVISELVYWLALAASFSLVITFLVTDKLNEGFVWIGYLFIILQGTIVVTTIITNKYLEKINLFKTSIIGMTILLISALFMIFSNNIYFAAFAMFLEGIGAGIWVPSKTALQWNMTPKEIREEISGFFAGWRGVTSTIGPLFGGILVVSLGITAPFYFKALLSIFSIMIYIYIYKKIKK